MTASRLAQKWESHIAYLRADGARTSDYADLLATVDPRWHGAVETSIWGGGILGISPAERSPIHAVGLQVRRSKSGFSMELVRRQPSLGVTVAERARATVPDAPAALARMLATMFTGREVAASEAASGTWHAMVSSLRADAAESAGKVGLLESVAAGLRVRCEVHDNGQVFGIIRIGDAHGDAEGIWISQVSDGWSFTHRVDSPGGNSSRILGEVTAGAQSAAGNLNELLEEIVSRMPGPELSALDAYRALLRDHVAPALRRDGYTGSGSRFRRIVDEHGVFVQFQKARFSTQARVDYQVHIDVIHRATAELFRQANEEAMALGRRPEGPSGLTYEATLPDGRVSRGGWYGLRPDDDLARHAARVLADIRSAAVPSPPFL